MATKFGEGIHKGYSEKHTGVPPETETEVRYSDYMEKTLHISIVVSGKDVDLTDPINWFLQDCKALNYEVKLDRADSKIYYTEKRNGADNTNKSG